MIEPFVTFPVTDASVVSSILSFIHTIFASHCFGLLCFHKYPCLNLSQFRGIDANQAIEHFVNIESCAVLIPEMQPVGLESRMKGMIC